MRKFAKTTVGKVLIITTLVVILVIIFIIISGTKEQIGSFEVNENGGSFTNEVIVLQLNDTQKATKGEIGVFRQKCDKESGDNIEYQSNYSYSLEGKAGTFSGILTIKLPIPENVAQEISNGASMSGKVYIVAELQAYNAHSNECFTKNIELETTVESGFATATFNLQKLNTYKLTDLNNLTTGLFFGNSEKFVDERKDHFSIDEDFWLAFHLKIYESPVITIRSSSMAMDSPPVFRFFIEDKLNEENLVELIDETENHIKWLQFLNFNFNKISLPIDIKFRNDSKEAVNEVLFNGFNNLALLEIDAEKYMNEPIAELKQNSEWDNFKAAFGHSLMHIVLASYTGKVPSWFDEAIASWYEPISIHNSEFQPINITENLNFIQYPLLTPPISEITSENDFQQLLAYGKGNALLISYLSSITDAFFPSRLYETWHKEPLLTPIEAIEKVLPQSNLEQYYPKFAAIFFYKPQLLLPQLTEVQTDALFADYKINGTIEGENIVEWTYIPPDSSSNVVKGAGNPNIEFQIERLSCKTMKIDFSQEGVISQTKVLNLQLLADDNVGAYIYYRANNDWYSFTGISWEYLSQTNKELRLNYLMPLYLVFFNKNETISKAKLVVAFTEGETSVNYQNTFVNNSDSTITPLNN